MDIDLKPGWERKALIIIGVITFIIVIYAYNPFQSSPDINVQNQTTETPVAVPVPSSPVETPDNSTANNTTAVNTTNGTFQISADVAKNIAVGANPGFAAGQPTQGTVNINSTVFNVWIVPLTQGYTSKKVYVDLSTGVILPGP